MNIALILEMAASGGDRPAVTADGRSLSAARLLDLARAAAGRFREYPAVLYLGTSHLAYPVALFGAALAGVPFVPLNYRLGGQQLDGLRTRHPGALVLEPGDLDQLLDPPVPRTAKPSPRTANPPPSSSTPAGPPPRRRRPCSGTGTCSPTC